MASEPGRKPRKKVVEQKVRNNHLKCKRSYVTTMSVVRNLQTRTTSNRPSSRGVTTITTFKIKIIEYALSPIWARGGANRKSGYRWLGGDWGLA